MTEANLHSSQESPPLCQDTLGILLNVLNDTSNGTLPALNLMNPSDEQDLVNNFQMLDGQSTVQYLGELSAGIQVPPMPYPTRVSLPAVSNWPGEYSFNVFIESQDLASKKVSWTYSEPCNKLYVKKDAPCPINFSTNVPMRKGVFIRATVVYSEPKDAHEIVTRCINHSMEEIHRKIFEAEHLIRCESALPSYEIDNRTLQHSVCVPYENPPVGQGFSTYLYKFVCFSSCSGGPNRRPITLIFTLEHGNEEIGRRCFELKVCACPGRDRMNDEKLKARVAGIQEPIAQQPVAQEPQLLASPPKKAKLSTNNQAVLPKKKTDTRTSDLKKKPRKDLWVKADDEAMYKYLVQMRNFYMMGQRVSRVANNPRLYVLVTSSDEEDKKS